MAYPCLYVNYSEKYEKRKHYIQGSAPDILKKLIDYFDAAAKDIREIYCCMYLYNNPILHSKMKELAGKGIKIIIISLPLEGYDNKSNVDLYDLETGNFYGRSTKYQMAEKIYQEIVTLKSPFYQLFMFPHIYVRSKNFNNFSRGKLPYSLHAKGVFVKFKNGTGVTSVLSSNLAACDTVKNEILVMDAINGTHLEATSRFYETLIKNSVLLTKTSFQLSGLDIETHRMKSFCDFEGLFMAPFIENSPPLVDDVLSKYVEYAKKWIYLSGQHIACNNGEETISEKPMVLKSIFKMAGTKDVNVHCLSQTYVDTDGNTHGQNEPDNKEGFIRFTAAVDFDGGMEYIVNRDTHAKFIVIDNTAIITTFNFTPTQFIYKQIDIDGFRFDKSMSYHGVYSEVGFAIVVKDEELCQRLIGFYEVIKKSPKTYIHNRRKCPECNNGEMKLKKGKYGFFLGCTKFPACYKTENIPLLRNGKYLSKD